MKLSKQTIELMKQYLATEAALEEALRRDTNDKVKLCATRSGIQLWVDEIELEPSRVPEVLGRVESDPEYAKDKQWAKFYCADIPAKHLGKWPPYFLTARRYGDDVPTDPQV